MWYLDVLNILNLLFNNLKITKFGISLIINTMWLFVNWRSITHLFVLHNTSKYARVGMYLQYRAVFIDKKNDMRIYYTRVRWGLWQARRRWRCAQSTTERTQTTKRVVGSTNLRIPGTDTAGRLSFPGVKRGMRPVSHVPVTTRWVSKVLLVINENLW